MANSPQARKRARQENVRRARNAGIRTNFRTVVKAAVAAARSGDADAATAAFLKMQSTVDKAVQKINVHHRTAARIKRRVNQLMIRTQAAQRAAGDSSAGEKSA